MSDLPRFPRLCRVPARLAPEDPIFAVASLGSAQRPGVALSAQGGSVEVVVTSTGEVRTFNAADVIFGLRADLALAVMDAIEEAIEDAMDQQNPDTQLLSHLENTLALFEQGLDDDDHD